VNNPSSKKVRALEVLQRLRDAGFAALFAGGAVRDMVMGAEPKDYDIVTNASLTDIERLFEHVYPIGSRFGVCLVVEDGIPFEVAGFRKDGIYEDGRRPSFIESADEVEDVMRRDFTINGLLYDPIEEKLLDYVGGVCDIRNHIVRTIGDPHERLREDRLRMLRAVRFAARFSFSIDPSTAAVLRDEAEAVLDVSAERIGEELSKMFMGPHAGRALSLLDETGLLDVVLPEVHALKGVDQPQGFHPEGDVFEHTRLMLDMFDEGTETLAFGILLHDIAKPSTRTESDRIRFTHHEAHGAEMAGKILRRLRMRNTTISRVQYLVGNHMRFINVKRMKRSTLLRFVREEGFDELLELYRFDCLASHGKLDTHELVQSVVEEEKRKYKNLVPPAPVLTGKDLIEIGFEPGPLFGTILNEVEELHLEGELGSRNEAIDFVRRNYPARSERRSRKRKSNPPD